LQKREKRVQVGGEESGSGGQWHRGPGLRCPQGHQKLYRSKKELSKIDVGRARSSSMCANSGTCLEEDFIRQMALGQEIFLALEDESDHCQRAGLCPLRPAQGFPLALLLTRGQITAFFQFPPSHLCIPFVLLSVGD
jgi:hypothetical protein